MARHGAYVALPSEEVGSEEGEAGKCLLIKMAVWSMA